jgi:NarL family two-component system sensor histidine kinase LiaS
MPRSLSARLVLSHVLTATLTSFLVIVVLMTIVAYTNTLAQSDRLIARFSSVIWLYDMKDTQGLNLPEGFTVVLSPDLSRVEYAYGETPCTVGMDAHTCLPAGVSLEPGERSIRRGSARWTEVVEDTVTGHRLVSQRKATTLGALVLTSLLPFSVILTILSVPVAIGLAYLASGRLTRRLNAITTTSQRFADGDFSARLDDSSQDDIGRLAQQFNSMADGFEQNVNLLRDLAHRNADLAQRAEESAIQAERARLSRELHDDIAQRLFSLSMSTASLADVIQRDQQAGMAQAQQIAELAEQAQLDLRAVIMGLRPTRMAQHSLSDALEVLCIEWSQQHTITLDYSVVLSGRRLLSSVEDVLYRVSQEALSNVARHASASAVTLSLVESSSQIMMRISDNGQGFDPAASLPGRFGLIGMRERIRSVGGQLIIESTPGQGAALQVVIPLERKDKTL